VLVRLALGFGEGAAFPTATRAMAAWMPPGQWGFAQGITHSFSRLGNALTPPLIAWLIAVVSWRGSFVVLGAASLIWMVVWVWFFRDDPRTHPRVTAAGCGPKASGRTAECALAEPRPPGAAGDRGGFLLWLDVVAIPQLSAGVFLSGVVGDTLGGVISDRILKRTGNLRAARCSVIAAGLFGGFVFMIPVVLVHDLTVVALCLSLAFFFVELVVAPIWSVPMDIAPRYAGSASGIMNFGFGMAGIISPWVFGYAIDLTSSWTLPFLGSIALLLIGPDWRCG
jgi:MFS family permease